MFCFGIYNSSFKLAIAAIIAVFLCLPSSYAQDDNLKYERFRIGEIKDIHSGIALSPQDENIVAISGNKSAPVYIYNWNDDEVINKFDVENWYAGSSIEYSANGNYIILNQLFYVDWLVSKDKKVFFVIIDNNGQRILKIDDSNEVKISRDEKKAISLSGDKITEYDLASGKAVNTFGLPEKGFGFALSHDGSFIAVSHEPREDDLKSMPQFKKNKQALKNALKYKHQITIYSYPQFEKVTTINEFYDNIYELKFRQDDSELYCLQKPHAKAQTGGLYQTYLNIIKTANWEPIRKGFVSKAPYQPDFKLSNDGRFFGLVSQGGKFPELHIYDYEKNRHVDRFEFSYRLIESDEEGLVVADNRPTFVFLPDNESILMAFGNRLFTWKFKQE